MRAIAELKPPSQIDPKLLHRVFFIDHFCLIAAGIIALINLVPDIITPLAKAPPTSWLDMSIPSVAMTLCAVFSLYFSEATQSDLARRLGTILGTLTTIIAVASFLVTATGSESTLGRIFTRSQMDFRQGSLEFTSGAFFLVGIAILFASSSGPRAGRVADGIALILSFLALALVSELLFRLAGMPSSSAARPMSIPTLWCIAILALVVAFRRTEGRFLSVLWGYGTGSRIARILAPIPLLLPVLREIARARLLRAARIPATYAAALLTSAAAILGLILLFVLARMINRMQEKVQDSTLRDELTGLLNARGFYLLAEQAFRHSRRTQEPFCALFVDMDNLKTINDKLGHSMGSVSLVETAKLLTANFRDTDVIGRVGGDEFIVAGQFNNQEIAAAVERLRDAVARKNDVLGQQFSISLSLGHAVAEDFARETLHSLVGKADEAMYAEKRSKKEMQAVNAAQNEAAPLRVFSS
jgi:diguanylate cyclase (GGDEF)-like protein